MIDPPVFGDPPRGDLAAARQIDVDDDDRSFTAEHVALVVPPVDQEASRHLKRLVANWGVLADLAFADLLLYVALPGHDEGRNRFLVVNQVRPNTSPTLFVDDVVGRSMDATQRPLVAQALATGQIVDDVIASPWLGDDIRVMAIPVRFRGSSVAVVASESSLSLNRDPSNLAVNYRDVFFRLARMVAEGIYPFAEEEVVGTGGPRVGDGVILLDHLGRVSFASPNAVSALRRIDVREQIMGKKLTDLGAEVSASYRAFFNGQPTVEDVERDDAAVVIRCIPLITSGRVDGALVLLRDVSEVRSRDRLLVSKDATIKEIHHRVKNNLQTISSLLRLQGRRLSEPSAKTAIEESVRRIRSIALGARDAVPGRRRRRRLRRGRAAARAHGRGGPHVAGPAGRVHDLRLVGEAALPGRHVVVGGGDRAVPERRRPRLSARHRGSWPRGQGAPRDEPRCAVPPDPGRRRRRRDQ